MVGKFDGMDHIFRIGSDFIMYSCTNIITYRSCKMDTQIA